MKKTVYSFRDGLVLTVAAAIIANIDPSTKKADVVNASGEILVKGAAFSDKPADGCWSEIEEYVPGPPVPDTRDAEIAALKARVAELESGDGKKEPSGKK